MSQDTDTWVADLRAAGWREVRLNVWRRPDGALFRGPYGAWCQLQIDAADLRKSDA